MTLQPRERRSLAFLAVSVILTLAYTYWPADSGKSVPVSTDAIPFDETRLQKLRDIAATVPQKEEQFKKVSADLGLREKGLIAADTAQQAQAQLIQLIRRLGRAENPPIEIRSTEFPAIRPLGDGYGEAAVSVQIECRIDQLVNLLAALGAQPELAASSDLRITSGNPKDKTIGVRLTVSGVVPRKLVPEKKKGASAF